MQTEIDAIVSQFDLKSHPEGGFYAESSRSKIRVDTQNPHRNRSAGTSIYYLLTHDTCSHFHRLTSDEIWHFYRGSPLEIVVLDPNTRKPRTIVMGQNLDRGQVLQTEIQAGDIFGARLVDRSPGEFALVGCNVFPGFEFADFELVKNIDRGKLPAQFHELIPS